MGAETRVLEPFTSEINMTHALFEEKRFFFKTAKPTQIDTLYHPLPLASCEDFFLKRIWGFNVDKCPQREFLGIRFHVTDIHFIMFSV